MKVFIGIAIKQQVFYDKIYYHKEAYYYGEKRKATCTQGSYDGGQKA